MKKIVAIIILFTSIFISSCEKQNVEIEQKANETHTQKEIAKFISNIDQRGNDASGQIIIYSDGKTPSKETFFVNENEFVDILGPIIAKLSTEGSVSATSEEEGGHGSADCTYCSKIGGIRCGNSIAAKIPENAGDIHVTISKKDKKGCRTIHVEW
jgi:hypothetical protein